MKNYEVTENGVTATVQASSQVKALAIHFGVERPVKCMSSGRQQEWANCRFSKSTRSIHRVATIREVSVNS